MKYKLVIAPTILTKVKGSYTDDTGALKHFDFLLEQDRIEQDELQQILTDKSENAADFIKRITRGWRGQRLVLNDDNSAADFCDEAMGCLLSISGMGAMCFQCYLDQVLVKQKN